MQKYLKTATNTALEAGRLLKRNFSRPKKIAFKGEIDMVTDSDLGSEEIIIKSLKKAFPNHEILAEEANGKTKPGKNKGYRWIIDPLDGTTNFAHNYPLFAVSIALEYKGKIILGVAYNPLLNELFTAITGRGAYLNGKKISVSKQKKLDKSFLATGFPYNFRQTAKRNLDYFGKLQMAAQDIRRDGSAVLNMCYVACGRFEGFWEMNLQPWDTAAGLLIVKEAGGLVTDFSGKKFSVYKGNTLASNGKIHKQMLKILSH